MPDGDEELPLKRGIDHIVEEGPAQVPAKEAGFVADAASGAAASAGAGAAGSGGAEFEV